MKRIHVDAIEALPALDGELQWKPVRHELGVSAFGINAYHGAKAGDLVVEEHADRHQELYLVLTGTVRFRSGDDEFDAPAGTFVLFEPEEHRVAHAGEPETTVVAIGAEAARFEPSRWEYSFRATGLARLGRHDQAQAAIREGLERYPGDASVLYNSACVEAMIGNDEAALDHLEQALEGEPKFKQFAREDSDFEALRDNPRFQSTVAGEPGAPGSGS